METYKAAEQIASPGSWRRPSQVALAYAIIAGLWIFVSDQVLLQWADSTVAQAKLQTWKGTIFVVFTTLLLFGMLNRQFRKDQHAAEQLQLLLERCRTLFETANDAIIVADAAGGFILEANQKAGELVGIPASQLIGKHQTRLHPPEEAERYARIFRQAVARGGGIHEPLEIMHGKGHRIPVEISARVVKLRDRDVVMGIFRNLTERACSELLIRQLSRAVEQSPVLILITDMQGAIQYVNPKFTEVTGYTADEVLGKNPRLLKSGCAKPEEYARMWQTLRAGQEWRGTFLNRKKNGEEYWVAASISAITDESGIATHYVAVQEDITSQRAAEERMREQAALLDIAQDAILVRDLAGRVQFWNQGAQRLYGWSREEALQQNISDLLDLPESQNRLQEIQEEVIGTGQWRGELNRRTKAGHTVLVEARFSLVRHPDGAPKSILCVATDITQQKSMEKQFLRAQRLESVGVLASGVAHDLNNILAPILMAGQMLEATTDAKEQQRLLVTIQECAQRGAQITQQLLAFARGKEGERVLLQPRHLLKELLRMLHETFPKSIAIDADINGGIWPVTGDATQLQQVLLNLCLNARDAMPEGGALILRAENVHLADTDTATLRAAAGPGPYVAITVADTGSGIPPAILDRIFDPFFTSKELGHGTGLGLSTVLGIVKSHGGAITVESELGKGTTFKVFIPASPQGQVAIKSRVSGDLPRGHGEWVLVIDDEAAIRQLFECSLRRSGYHVITAPNGVEGIRLFSAHQHQIQAVITDLMMPFMDGAALIRSLRAIAPEIPVLAISGLGSVAQRAELDALQVTAFLHKPFSMPAVYSALRQALDHRP